MSVNLARGSTGKNRTDLELVLGGHGAAGRGLRSGNGRARRGGEVEDRFRRQISASTSTARGLCACPAPTSSTLSSSPTDPTRFADCSASRALLGARRIGPAARIDSP